MALMMGELYQALRDSGASEEQARKAASEVADFSKQLAEVRSDLAVVKAVTAATLALVVALFIRTFFV